MFLYIWSATIKNMLSSTKKTIDKEPKAQCPTREKGMYCTAMQNGTPTEPSEGDKPKMGSVLAFNNNSTVTSFSVECDVWVDV
jgi:hypothetical protein